MTPAGFKYEEEWIHCTRCGSDGAPETFTPGSLAVEIALWLFLLVPGVFYTLWRRSVGRYTGCAVCRAKETVPLSAWKARVGA